MTHSTPKTRNIWLIILMISIALNGLLGGMLLALRTPPPQAPTDSPPAFSRKTGAGKKMGAALHPRRLLRALPNERRQQVMTAALKNLAAQDKAQPRQLFKRLRRQKREIRKILRTQPLDMDALVAAQAQMRTLNQELAVSGDALMVEILRQLTPEERALAFKAMSVKKGTHPHKDPQQNRP